MDASLTNNRQTTEQPVYNSHGQDKLVALFMQAPAAIAVLEGPEHTYTFVNPLYQKLFGRSEKELLGRTLQEVFPELEGQGIYNLFDDSFSTGIAFTANEFAATFLEDGETKTGYYNFVIQPIKDDAGAVTDLMVHAYDVTEQVKAYKRTTESEEKYRSLFQIMDQGFCIVEMIFDAKNTAVDYRFIEANPVFEEQTGLKDVIGKTAKELVPGLEGHWFETYGNVALTGEPVRFAEGSEAMGRWFEVYAFRMGEAGTKKVAILFTDITLRKKAEEAVNKALEATEKQKRFYEAVTNNTPDLVYVFDLNYRFTYANKALLAMWGRSWEAAIGKGLRDLGYEEWHAAMHEGEIDEIAATKKPIRGTVSFPHAVLGKRTYDYILAPIINEQSEVEAIAGSTRDITDIKMAEEAMKESEQRFRSLANDTPAFMFLADANTNVEFVNRQWLEFVGLPSEEGIGKAWADITHPDDVAPMYAVYTDSVINLKPYQFEIRQKRHDGVYRWVLWNGIPRTNPDGTFAGMTGVGIDVTEQKQSERTIIESKEQFQAAIQATEGILWTNSAHGEMEGQQAGWSALTGQAYADYQGYGWAAAVHPDDAQPTVDAWNEAVAERKPFVFEHRVKKQSGEWGIFSIRAIPLLNADGTIREWVGVHTEITQRKQIENALSESEQRFRNLIREATVGIVVLVGEEMKVTVVNDAYAALIGRSAAELIDQNLFAIIPEAEAYFRPVIDGVRTSGEPLYLYGTPYFVWVDGIKKEGFLNLVYQPYREADGRLSGVMVLCHDVTEQMVAQQRIEASEERFRLLADKMPQFVWTGDAAGTLSYFNQAVYAYSGLSPEEVATNGWVQIVHPDEQEENIRLWRQAIATGDEFIFEHRFRRADGVYRWQLSRAVPQRDAAGIIQQWIGTSTDIQEQKSVEEGLETIVQERTKELNKLNRQLQQSNEDLQQFAHVASHDLKEPVRKIKTFAGRLQDELGENINERGKLFLNKVNSATDRMFTMIDGVLTYSSLNAAAQSLEAVDLNEVLKNIETDLEVVIHQTGAAIRYSGLPVLEGAPVLLYQLFYNLVNNSLKFAKAGVPPVVSIQSQTVLEGQNEAARIVLKDNGIGFDQEQSQKIFETFTRLHSKDKYEGTGLGLALCKKIVERHGGGIEAKSNPGTGAAFIITLPFKQTQSSI